MNNETFNEVALFPDRMQQQRLNVYSVCREQNTLNVYSVCREQTECTEFVLKHCYCVIPT